jgi:hypothetical protein
MSDTPKDPGAGSGETPEYRDPTAPVWNPGEERPEDAEGARDVTWSGDETRAVPAESTQQLPAGEPAPGQPTEPPAGSPGLQPPAGPGVPTPYGQAPPPPQGPYGQAPSPYGEAQNPYAAGAPGGYPTARPGPPPVPGAPGTLGAGFPPGPPPGYGQPGYGPPAPYGQGPGYAPSPYARPQQTNTSAIALTVVSGLSTLVGCFFAIPALVLGIMALVKQGESPADSAKFARWGWIAYAIAVAFVVIGGIIAIAVVASTSSTGY